MNALFVFGVFTLLRGWWLLPSTSSETRRADAPYRAVRGALYFVAGGGMIWTALIFGHGS